MELASGALSEGATVHGRSQTAGSFFDAGPKVWETTKPLACEV
jgi:hypothetical protein